MRMITFKIMLLQKEKERETENEIRTEKGQEHRHLDNNRPLKLPRMQRHF